MKKFLTVILTITMVLGYLNLTAFAGTGTKTENVYVTIANKGELVVTCEQITVTDKDNSGDFTIDEVLYAAHEAKYTGGAAAGYNSYIGDYGLSLGKLWGDNSGNFGYYVNNASAWSLADNVQEGDYVNAFVYSDGVTWSDTYCWFDVTTTTAEQGKEISLTLSGAGYDASWNPVTVAVEGVNITLNGVKTEYKTDAEGKVKFTVPSAGNYTISAVLDTMILVPPVCKATITPSAQAKPEITSPKTGEDINLGLLLFVVIMSAGLLAVLFVTRKKPYEKQF